MVWADWDLPLALQTPELRGWLDRAIVPLFRAFAELCFREYGGKVKYWTTFNEAWTFTVLGYGTGSKAPGAPYTDIARNPYLAGHHVLLAFHSHLEEGFLKPRFERKADRLAELLASNVFFDDALNSS